MGLPEEIATQLIKKYEGCRLVAYKDAGGVWTNGWGATGHKVHEGQVITQEIADEWLAKDVCGSFYDLGASIYPLKLTTNQLAALTSLVYNIGDVAFRTSSLRERLMAGDRASAAEEFLRWDHVDGKEIAGLLARRKAEMELFLTPC